MRACLVCGREAKTVVALCHTHHERWRRWGKPPVAEWAARFRAGRLCTCDECGRGYNGYFKSRFCSKACRTEYKRRAALAHWHRRSPESKQSAMTRSKELVRTKRRAGMVDLWCKVCGDPFVGYPSRKTCSDDCRDANRRMGVANWHGQKRGVGKAINLSTKLEERRSEQRADQDRPDARA